MEGIELRCESRLHGIIVDDGIVEVKCNSRFCGARPGVVRLHRFDVKTGELLGTKEYRSIEFRRREK